MAAYAVQVRIERVQPHRPARRPERPRVSPVLTPSAVTDLDDFGAVEIEGPASRSPLGERWGRIGERWSQLTFYLFDAESWRR